MKSMRTPAELILQRAEEARRLGGAYHAESVGLLASLHCEASFEYSSDRTMQAAFLRGFLDGRSIRRVEEAASR